MLGADPLFDVNHARLLGDVSFATLEASSIIMDKAKKRTF